MAFLERKVGVGEKLGFDQRDEAGLAVNKAVAAFAPTLALAPAER
jgi:hypothetical protein